MALAHLVYPGAVHTRLHHSLGAYHLMCNALSELKAKGTDITREEEEGAKIAILLHDIGHGPFSHGLEAVLFENFNHEELSLLIMEELNREFKGALQIAIEIFKNIYPKKFLHQLVSGQLDVDRMDYLTRDSFFTGVSEGVIGYDRILKMLIVHEGQLMVEEKAIYSIEKFLVSRRLMYWQVYLHKTVLGSEMMLVKILERAKQLGPWKPNLGAALDKFLYDPSESGTMKNLDLFCKLDDTDITAAIKSWCEHPDKVLSILCKGITGRALLKMKFENAPIPQNLIDTLRAGISLRLGISKEDASFLAFSGEATNRTYDPSDERINILFKDGKVLDISQVDNALIHHNLSRPVKKFYICFLK